MDQNQLIQLPVFVNKVVLAWEAVLPIPGHVVSGWFCTNAAELSGWDRDHVICKPEIFISCSFPEKCASPALDCPKQGFGLCFLDLDLWP